MVEGAALEMLCTEMYLGFESLTLRQKKLILSDELFCHRKGIPFEAGRAPRAPPSNVRGSFRQITAHDRFTETYRAFRAGLDIRFFKMYAFDVEH